MQHPLFYSPRRIYATKNPGKPVPARRGRFRARPTPAIHPLEPGFEPVPPTGYNSRYPAVPGTGRQPPITANSAGLTMKRIFSLCLASAAAGGLGVVLLQNLDRDAIAVASPPRGGVVDDADGAEVGPRVPDLQDAAEFTAEERRNIAVYEAVNCSVVNINTKVVRADAFMLFEIPSEGAGSGSVLDEQGHVLTNNHVIDRAGDSGHAVRRTQLRSDPGRQGRRQRPGRAENRRPA